MSMVPFDGDIARCLKWLQQNAPNIQSLVNQKAAWYDKYNTQFWSQWETNVFDLRTANNFGLMVWAIILGVPTGGLGLYPNVAAFAFGPDRENFIASSDDITDPSTGGNFYGAGQTAVGSIEEIRKLLQLRYVALTSRGNIAQTNRMLKYIFNENEDWDFSGGKYFYVMDVNGTPKTDAPVSDLAIYRNDWQGNLLLSPSARTNLIQQSTIPGGSASPWDDVNCLMGFANHWQGMVGTRIFAMNGSPSATDGLNYGQSGQYLDLAAGVYNLTAFYQPGLSGRIRIGFTDTATGNFYGFSGVIGGTLSNISSDLTKATVSLSSDVLFDQTNGVRRIRILLTVKSEISAAMVNVGPNTTLKDKDVVLYGMHLEAGSVFGSFISNPSAFSTRSTAAAYYNRQNVLMFSPQGSARSNCYRVNQNGELVNIGLLMEPETTNYVSRPVSVDQSNAAGGTGAVPMAVSPLGAMDPSNGLCMDHVLTLEAGSPQIIVAPGFTTPAGKQASASLFFSAGDNANFVTVRFYGTPTNGAKGYGVEASFDLKNGVVAMLRKLDGVETDNVIGIWADMESAGVHDGRQVYRCAIGATAGPALLRGFTSLQYMPASSSIGITSYAQRAKGDDVYVWHIGGIVVEPNHYPSSLIKPTTVFASRASVASYIDEDGVMQFEDANTLRVGTFAWDRNNELKIVGDFTEATATQLAPTSDDLASWQLVNTVLADESAAAVAPTGAAMKHLVDNGTLGIHAAGAPVTTTPLEYYCGSVFVSRNGLRYAALVIGLDTSDCASIIFDTQTWEVVSYRDSPSSVLRCLNFDVVPFGPGVYRIYLATQCPSGVSSLSFNIMGVNDTTQWPPVYAGAGTGVYVWGAQFELGVVPSSYISNTSATTSAVRAADILTKTTTVRGADVAGSSTSVTDYTLLDSSTGQVSFAQPPLLGADLTWTGKWNGATQNDPMNFGTGDGVTAQYTLDEPLSVTSPVDAPFKLEYRVGPNMGLSSQLINLLNDETMELLPRTAGVKATVIQET